MQNIIVNVNLITSYSKRTGNKRQSLLPRVIFLGFIYSQCVYLKSYVKALIPEKQGDSCGREGNIIITTVLAYQVRKKSIETGDVQTLITILAYRSCKRSIETGDVETLITCKCAKVQVCRNVVFSGGHFLVSVFVNFLFL